MLDRPAIDTALTAIQQQIDLGLWESAESACRQLLGLAPQEAPAWFRLGVIQLHTARAREAEASLRQAIAFDPRYAGSWNNLSVALREQGQAAAAEAASRQALALDSANASHWLNLGNALYSQGRWEEAARAYRQSLALHENDAGAWSNLGAAEQRRGRLAAAQEAYERSLALAPGYLGAQINLAYLLTERGQPQGAVQLLEQVLRQNPDLTAAWVARGNALKLLGELEQAEGAYRQAIQLSPRHISARYSLALLLLLRWSLPEAAALAKEVLTDDPKCAEAWTLLGAVQQAEAQSEEALLARRRSVEIEPNADRHSMLLLGMQYAAGVTAQELLQAHQAWDRAYAQPLDAAQPPPIFPNHENQPLRIGFVSTDFGFHPIGFLALRAIECLRELDCTVLCYNDRLAEDAYTRRFRAAAHEWRQVAGFSHEELAELIRRDEVDVLFDLIGHVGKRLMVFARRPAPLQVTWLGYVGTTGLAAMDYVLADRHHIRSGEEAYYVERVLRMPRGYTCYGPPVDAPAVGPLPALAKGRVTLGCFNNPAKFSPRILGAWAEILRSVPGSDLLLRYGGLQQPSLQERLRGRFVERGIEPERILFEGWSPHREMLGGYSRVDLALDTQPYSGGLTTCEALWMGVPVVTFPGQTFAGRHSVSYLTTAGYGECIAADAADYVRLAVDWSSRLDELVGLRAQMRQRVGASPLCNGPAFARDLLAVLSSAWKSRMSG